MKLTKEEQAMLNGEYGAPVAEAIDYIIQLGEAFNAEKLVDIVYCHYPAEMGIYKGSVEEAVEFSKTGAKMRVPTTSSTLCADVEKPYITCIPQSLANLQKEIVPDARMPVAGRAGGLSGMAAIRPRTRITGENLPLIITIRHDRRYCRCTDVG